MTRRRLTCLIASVLLSGVAGAHLAFSAGSSGGTGNMGDCDPEPAPGATWQPYGTALPPDPTYGFGYPNPNTGELLGLAAKGNIIIGDYTSAGFQSRVVPKLTAGNPQAVTQPYPIDPSDVPLGYGSGMVAGVPYFDGDYDRWDGGFKLDGTQRKFYESTLSDGDFRDFLDRNQDGTVDGSDDGLFKAVMSNTGEAATIEAVLFTNHAVAGDVPARTLRFNGAVIARDDALMFTTKLEINYDIRLLEDSLQIIALPYEIKRPRLVSWEEVNP